ncbi:MAG: PAS domain S-box protein, partial [Nitrospinota bacterium]
CRHLGYAREALLSMTVFDINPDRTAETWPERWEKLKKKGSVTFESRHVAKDGRVVPVEITDNYLEFEGKVYSCSFVRDITERKRAEEALRSSEEKYRMLFEEAGDAIITVDLEGRVTSWNPAAEAIYGYSAEEALGRDIGLVFPPGDPGREGFLGARDRLLAGESLPSWETVRRRKDGTLIEVSLSSSPVKDAEGRVVGLMGISRDISDRKRAEEALARQAAAMNAAREGIAILNEDHVYLYVNEAHARMYGYDRPEDLVGGSWRMLYDERELRRFEGEVFPKFLEDGWWQGEAVGRKRDGRTFSQEVSLSRLEGGGTICVVRDITERKRAEEMLTRNQKLAAMGRLTAGVAHEILNPANIIGMHAQGLMRDPEIPEAVRKSSDDIYQNVKRIAKICGGLRRFSREEKPAVSRFDLLTIIRETVSVLEPQSRLENKTFSLDLPDGPLCVEADRDQIAQVLFNLINNAQDAMNDGGVITLSAEAIQQNGTPWVRFSVRDEGAGIPPEVRPRIFDPFFTTKDVAAGTGLGLSIVHGIVEDHGGRIDVQTEVGEGTVFHVALPARSNGARPGP